MLTTIIAFIIILGVLVFVHEAGHFLAAKKAGVQVDEFGLGFPPKIWGFKRGGTLYSLNWIPLGGFVRLKGEDGSDRDDPKSFAYKSFGQRGLILSAGVLMNILLAAVILSIGFMAGLPSAVDRQNQSGIVSDVGVQIVSLVGGSPADLAGLVIGDRILYLDQQEITSQAQVTEYVQSHQNEEIIVRAQRSDKQVIEVKVKPEILAGFSDHGKTMGVTIVDVGLVKYGFFESLYRGFAGAFKMLWKIILAFYTLLAGLITGQGLAMQISGPVGVAAMTGQVVDLGYRYVLQFAAVLSLNLAVINFVPFPALDGGRFLFLVIEKLRGKPVKQAVENVIHNVGFGILMILIIVVTYNDVISHSGLIDKIKGFF